MRLGRSSRCQWGRGTLFAPGGPQPLPRERVPAPCAGRVTASGKPADPSPETTVRRRLPHLGKKLRVLGLLSSTPWAAEAGGRGGAALFALLGDCLGPARLGKHSNRNLEQ